MEDKIKYQKVNSIQYRKTMLRDLREEYSEAQINEIKERARALYLEAVRDATKRIIAIGEAYGEAIEKREIFKAERFQKLYYKELEKYLTCFTGLMNEAELREIAVQLFMKELKKSARIITGEK